MLERLIKSWLDSASERSYQSPFCQMLAAEGHVVVHSTAHTPMEFGKDIITIGPDRIACAFQLKGQPGGRMTLNDLREIRPQLLELVTHPIARPGVKRVRHRCYLVTNGLTDEAVHRSISDMNQELAGMGYGPNRIELWERGHILDMATRLGSSLWASGIEDLNTLLELLVYRGDDFLPIENFHVLLRRLFCLEAGNIQKLRTRELKRRITSAAVLVAVGLRNFSLKENHFATISAWTLFMVYVIGACDCHGANFNRVGAEFVRIAKAAVLGALSQLCQEITTNPKLAPRGMEIAPFFRGRATLLYGLMSTYWLWASEEGWPVAEHEGFLSGWIPKNFDSNLLWGEGAVPQFLAHYWFISKVDPSWESEKKHLTGLLASLVFLNLNEAHQEFPTPYFTFEDSMRHRLAPLLRSGSDPLEDETTQGTSYFAEGVLHLLVRANLKQTAKSIWPAFTNLGLKRFDPEQNWHYCLYHCGEGQGWERMVQTPPTRNWTDLVEDARDCRAPGVPEALLAEKCILLLFVLVLPYRATPSVVRFLGRKFGTVWFLPPPIE